MKSLNLGSGSQKIEGADNVDLNPETGAELNFDIRDQFPLEDQSYDEIYLFHTIEHIEKKHHTNLFREIRRVLKDDGVLIISYPEFSKIALNWLNNKDNNRTFWEATLYGRQLYPSDYHVSAIDSNDLKQFLTDRGFNVLKVQAEPIDSFNTIMKLEKGPISISYEELLYQEIFANK